MTNATQFIDLSQAGLPKASQGTEGTAGPAAGQSALRGSGGSKVSSPAAAGRK